jgi:hypothetical protein
MGITTEYSVSNVLCLIVSRVSPLCLGPDKQEAQIKSFIDSLKPIEHTRDDGRNPLVHRGLPFPVSPSSSKIGKAGYSDRRAAGSRKIHCQQWVRLAMKKLQTPN